MGAAAVFRCRVEPLQCLVQTSDFAHDQQSRRLDLFSFNSLSEFVQFSHDDALSRTSAFFDHSRAARLRHAVSSQVRNDVFEMTEAHIKDHGLARTG